MRFVWAAMSRSAGTFASVNPDPEIVSPRVTLPAVLLVTFTVCELLTPTGTLPKLAEEGVAVIGEAASVGRGSARTKTPMIATTIKKPAR